MNTKDLLVCELSNWDKFLMWLEKINHRASKRKNKTIYKQQEVKYNE